jgi:hypothetical protein
MHKTSVTISKNTVFLYSKDQPLFILFREIKAAYSKNHMEQIHHVENVELLNTMFGDTAGL